MIFIYLEEDCSANFLGKEIARESTAQATIKAALLALREMGVTGVEYEVIGPYGRRVETGFLHST